MSYSIESTPHFLREAKKLSKKYPSLRDDLVVLTENLSEHPEQGTPLGNDCYKIRLKIASKGKGKSGGGRVITCVVRFDAMVYLLTIYDKSEKESVSDAEIKKLVREIASSNKKRR